MHAKHVIDAGREAQAPESPKALGAMNKDEDVGDGEMSPTGNGVNMELVELEVLHHAELIDDEHQCIPQASLSASKRFAVSVFLCFALRCFALLRFAWLCLTLHGFA